MKPETNKQEARGLLIFSVMVAFMIGATCGCIVGSYLAYDNAKDTIYMLMDEIHQLNNTQSNHSGILVGDSNVYLPEHCKRIYNGSDGGIYCDLGQ